MGDAQPRNAQLGRCVTAVCVAEDEIGGCRSVGHEVERYPRPPTPATLIERALAVDLAGRDQASWLACQLRDNGHDGEVAFGAMADFARRVGMPSGDATRILRSVSKRAPREPWLAGGTR